MLIKNLRHGRRIACVVFVGVAALALSGTLPTASSRARGPRPAGFTQRKLMPAFRLPAATFTPLPTRAPTHMPGRGGTNLDPNLRGNLGSARSLLHVSSVRFAHNDPNLVSDARAVHAAGLQPIVIMTGCSVSDPTVRLTANKTLLKQMHQVFGAASIWWELGNENDLQCGLSATQYTTMWNRGISALRLMFPQDRFGGPVNFQANPTYIAYFVRHATPKPDFISWHEYTCASTHRANNCIRNVATWTTHVRTTRQDIAAVGLRAPPIYITEYNYAPDGRVCADAMHNDPTFITQWTTTALRTLAGNNVAESYQFDTANCLPLETPSGSLTPQGRVFATFW